MQIEAACGCFFIGSMGTLLKHNSAFFSKGPIDMIQVT